MTGPHASLGIVVLGMHRSGTSVAARLVNLMGFSLGPDEALMPPHPEDNPTGYWESAPLVDLNDEILLALGGEWSAPPRLDDGWETRPELDVLRPRAAALAASVLSAERWAWKDPRACLTLPFWLPVLDRELAIVFVHRNPLEVAASLRTRGCFPIALGLALWERYVRAALAASAGRPVCITRYEDLVADPGRWCRFVGDFLSARGVETSEIEPSVRDASVRPELRRTAFSAESLGAEPAVSAEQRALCAALEEGRGMHETFAPPALPPETPWVGALLDERRRHLGAARELEEAMARIAGIEASGSYRLLAPLRAVRAFFATRRRTS